MQTTSSAYAISQMAKVRNWLYASICSVIQGPNTKVYYLKNVPSRRKIRRVFSCKRVTKCEKICQKSEHFSHIVSADVASSTLFDCVGNFSLRWDCWFWLCLFDLLGKCWKCNLTHSDLSEGTMLMYTWLTCFPLWSVQPMVNHSILSQCCCWWLRTILQQSVKTKSSDSVCCVTLGRIIYITMVCITVSCLS